MECLIVRVKNKLCQLKSHDDARKAVDDANNDQRSSDLEKVEHQTDEKNM